MGDRDNRLVTYVTDEEKRRFEEWAADTDKSVSHLLREAVLEYLDHDRADRIEAVVRENNELLEQLAEGDTPDSHSDEHTHTSEERVTKASETVEKTRAIADRLQQNNNDGVSTTELERAIKDIGGGDPRTLSKYKSELRERGHAYEHPNDHSEVWFLDREPWANQLISYVNGTPDPEGTLRDVLDPYPVTRSEIRDEADAEMIDR